MAQKKKAKKTARKPKKKKTATKKKKTAKQQQQKKKKKKKKKTTTAAATVKSRTAPAKNRRKKETFATAESMGKNQRNISVSEFFAKNRHLLGFDNPSKALLTTIKEAVDNSLDACEEAGIMPDIAIRVEQLTEKNYRVSVTDNGPGIVKQQIPNIFGRLLYGSKFHRLKMSRGQQGIGISAAGMYGLLTTGRPVRITSRTSKRAKVHYYELKIDTKKNRPTIITDEIIAWDEMAHGTKVEIELEASYKRGRRSVDEYLRQTAIANSHVKIRFVAPDGREEQYDSTTRTIPPVPREIKPHPHGVELGVLIKMIHDTGAKTIQQFLTSEFSCVSPRVARQIIEAAASTEKLKEKTLTPRTRPSRIDADMSQALYETIEQTRIMAPRKDCIVPIGEDALIEGLKNVIDADFYTGVTRKPAVYRGNPFIIEAAVAYGKPGDKKAHSKADSIDELEENGEADNGGSLAKILRFANRVPLQYQQGACAITRTVLDIDWRNYGLPQSRGALPAGDITIVVHMGSVWVPFTSESKEAIAEYPEITKEIRLALQECGRKLGRHIRKVDRMRKELKKRSYIERYIPAIGEALRDILDLSDRQVTTTCTKLKTILEKSRKF